jgi:uncharacterized protein (TIGR00297 family)
MTHESQSRIFALKWQSQCLLVLVLVPLTAGIFLECIYFGRATPLLPVCALGFGALLTALVWRFRAATPAGAVAGGMIAAVFYLATPSWRTALWPLLALLLLTLAATRFGRVHKENLGVAESRKGRNAAQVAANLGVAGLLGITSGIGSIFAISPTFSVSAMKTALTAALAEAAADTLSSELGEIFDGEPRLLTTLQRVPAGTDGAISFPGTMAGAAAAAIVAVAASFALDLTTAQMGIVLLAALIGLFVDSLLGAVLERGGWLNNDAVNFLSTLAAASLAVLFS